MIFNSISAANLRRSRFGRVLGICSFIVPTFCLTVAAVTTAGAQSPYYYNGGTGAWDTTTSNWRTPTTTSTLGPWTNGNIANIGDLGAAGTVTLGAPITAQSLNFDLTGYTVAGTATNNLTLTSGNIVVNFLSGNTAAAMTSTISAPLAGTDLNISATGTAGSTTATSVGNTTVALSGANTFTGNVNLGAGASGTGGAGINRLNILTAAALPTTATVRYLNTNASVSINGGGVATLSNNFVLNPNGTYTAGAFTSYLGATSGNGLIANGTISGNGDLVFGAGINGGAGIVTLNSANTYAGSTTVSFSTTGVVRLGINNALPTTTALTFGDASSGNSFGALDLNGKSQTVVSLRTNLAASQTANGVVNTASTLATLTVNGSTSTTYASVIGVPANVTNLSGANNNIALAKAGASTLTLSGVNPYTGSTSISGGTLLLSTGSINGSTQVQVTNAGALTLNNATALGDTATLSLVSGTTLNLNAAAGTTETIGTLLLDGTPAPVGTYNAAQLMAFDSAINFNSLNGEMLTITSVPEPPTVLGGVLLIGAAGWSQRRRLRGA